MRRQGVGFNRRPQQEKRGRNPNTLWLGDVTSSDLDEQILTSIFGHEPGFMEVKIMKDKVTGRNMGYGFVEFSDQDSASNFLQKYAGQPIPGFQNRRFRLNWASFGVGKNDNQQNFSVFVGDLASDITDIVLYEVFKRHFKSCSGAKVVMDSVTQKSKGYGFVKFETAQDVDRAIREMDGKFVLGRQIKVAAAAKKKDLQVTKQSWKSLLKTLYEVKVADFEGNTGVSVGNLNSTIVEEDLYKIFSQFGKIEDIKIPPTEDRIGYIKFSYRPDAQKAIMIMNGKMLKNATIKVGWGKLVSKTICVNTLVAEKKNLTAAKEEKEKKVRQFLYQQWYLYQQTKLIKKHYLSLIKKIPGKKIFRDDFSKKYDVKKFNDHYTKRNFDKVLYNESFNF